MNQENMIITLMKEALIIILAVSAPPLLTAFIIGFIISIFQATTQIQEQTISYIPKTLGIFLVLILLMPWLLDQITRFSIRIMHTIPLIH